MGTVITYIACFTTVYSIVSLLLWFQGTALACVSLKYELDCVCRAMNHLEPAVVMILKKLAVKRDEGMFCTPRGDEDMRMDRRRNDTH